MSRFSLKKSGAGSTAAPRHPRKFPDLTAVLPDLKPRLSVRKHTREELLNAESELGRQLFGPIPHGHRREFFHDQNNVWIWYEEWLDPATGQPRQQTIRYEVRETGVHKKVAAGSYVKLEGAELENFRRATHAYLDIIKQHLYKKN